MQLIRPIIIILILSSRQFRKNLKTYLKKPAIIKIKLDRPKNPDLYKNDRK